MASEFPNEPEQPTPQPVPPPAPSALPPHASGMIGRIQRLATSTASEWQAIDGEATPAKSLFLTWAVPLAAIGPVFLVLGFVLMVGSFLLNFALIYAVALYALTLVSTWVLALIVDALAPNFGSTKNFDQAMKLVCYSMTAYFIAGVLNVFPDLAVVAALLGLAGVFLLWVGLPIVMKTPADKAPAYVGITAVAGALLIFASYKIAGAIAARFFISSMMGGLGGLGAFN